MEIIKHGIITPKGISKFRYNAWPSVVTLNNGELLCAWSGNRLGHVCPFGKVMISRSTDGGHTWRPPYVAVDTPLDDRDAGLCIANNGNIILTSFTNSRKLQSHFKSLSDFNKTEESKTLVDAYLSMITDEDEKRFLGSTLSISTDNGYSFSTPTLMPITSPHGPCVLLDGRILYVGRSFSDPSLASFEFLPDAIYALILTNDGKVNEKPYLIADKPKYDESAFFCEPHAAVMPDGSILLAIRVERKNKPFTIYLSRSTDGGKTFSTPVETGWTGAPPHIFVTKSKVVVIVYGKRCDAYGEYARISNDSGYTWSDEILLHSAPNGDLGYPCTTQNANGELVTVYYQKEELFDDYVGPNLIHYTIWKL